MTTSEALTEEAHELAQDETSNNTESEEKEEDLWRTVCISNLSDSLKEHDLRHLFEDCGTIQICTIKLEFGKGRVCYIQFNDNDSAQTALLLNDQSLDSKPLQIQIVDDSILANYKQPSSSNNTPYTPNITNSDIHNASTDAPSTTTTLQIQSQNNTDQQTALQTVQSMSSAKKAVNFYLCYIILCRNFAFTP